MANILTIGQTALIAAQAGINTAGQNIANASTPGYSRQSVLQTAVTPQPLGFGYLGQGVQVSGIQRIYNDFLSTQKLSAQSVASQAQVQYDQIQQLNNMLADSAEGLSPVMQDFFNNLQDISVTPADVTSRESALSSAAALTSRFNDFQNRFNAVNNGVNTQLTTSVQTINDGAKLLAALNQAIDRAQSSSNGQPANDLLDKRDQLIADLSKQVKVSVIKQNDQYDVYIGNGQPLVVGATVHNLKITPSITDPNKMEIAYEANSQAIMTADDLAGGALGGLLEFRQKTLEPTQNTVGLIAIGLADNINQLNKQGYGLNGSHNVEIFKLPAMIATPSKSNTGAASLQVTLSDSSKLTGSDYRLQKEGNNYLFTRIADNKLLISSSALADVQSAANAEGINIVPSEAITGGDMFLIRPTAMIAGGMRLNTIQPSDLAAASVSSASGDNSNILNMIALQTNKTLKGATISFQDAYAQMVSQVGSKTRELQLTSSSANSILGQADTAIQNVSGVNLDEEAAALLRYQQAYQAAGKVMQIASQMFETLLQQMN